MGLWVLSALDLSSICTSRFEVRLASSEEDILDAQKLRYRVFYEELDAQPSAQSARYKREVDSYDWQAEHLLIIDKLSKSLVACYRLMRRENLPSGMRFYSESEFDLTNFLSHPLASSCVELSRACVEKGFRTSLIPNIFLRAIGRYIEHHKIGLLFGCGSLPGTDLNFLSMALSWMYHHHLASESLRVSPLPHLFERMDRIPKHELDYKQAVTVMPPLIKGYLRMGCFVGDGAVIDQQFQTTDTFIAFTNDSSLDDHRYFQRYLGNSSASEETP